MRVYLIILVVLLSLCSACSEMSIYDEEKLDSEEMIKIEHFEQIDLIHLLGQDLDVAIAHFGQPTEKGPSYFNYEWLIFNHHPETYFQIGHSDNKIVTLFILGESLVQSPFTIGQTYAEVSDHVMIQQSITVDQQNGEYRFDLNEQDLRERPLVQLSEETFAQLYFDRHTNELVAIRLLDKETLLAQRPYKIVYRGTLEEIAPVFNKEEIEQSNVKQIFYITNVLRERYGKTQLDWNEQVANVAFNHSKDMKENDYFDHYSPNHGDLENRLKSLDVHYLTAGENIAAEYPDGISAVMGWLNSEGHRETMLYDTFTDLGVGVYDKHYTQNFITK